MAVNTPRSHGYGVIPTRAFDDTRMSANLVTVLGVLGTYADRRGRCWPSQTTLARRRGVTRQAISKSLLQLEAFGYIDITRRQGTSVYRLLFDGDLPYEFDRWRDEYDQGPSPLDEVDQALDEVQPDIAMDISGEVQSEVAPAATSEVAAAATPEVAQNYPLNNPNPPEQEGRGAWIVTSYLRAAPHPPPVHRQVLEAVVNWALGAGWRADQVLAALHRCQAFTRAGLDFNLRRAEQLQVSEGGARITPNPLGCDDCTKGWVESDGMVTPCVKCRMAS